MAFMVYPRLVLLAAFVSAAGAQHPAAKVPSNGSLRFIVCNTEGGPIRHFRIQVTDPESHRVRATTVDKTFVPDLPYGKYLVTIAAPLFRPLEREVTLHEPELLVVLGLPIPLGSQVSGEGLVVDEPMEGKIVGLPETGRTMWVRLSSLLGNFTSEALVLRSGTFYFPEVPNGDYLLAVYLDASLVGIQRVTLKLEAGRNAVIVDLAKVPKI
jgi:hypothetical protein